MLKWITSAMLVVLVVSGVAGADDMVPSWRGDANSTYQHWGFGTSANPAPPEDFVNINQPPPQAVITGVFPGTYHKAEDRNHLGVWKIDTMIELQIPNFPEPNPYKEILLQIIYDDGGANLPEFFVLPDASTIELISSVPVDDYYVQDLYRIIIEPNPPFESIYVMPRFCEIYIDDIIVDTRCVPEPASLLLLAIGALAHLRRRRA